MFLRLRLGQVIPNALGHDDAKAYVEDEGLFNWREVALLVSMVASRSQQECSENRAGLLGGSRWRLAWSMAGTDESVQFPQHEHHADQAVRESLPGVGAVRLRATIHH